MNISKVGTQENFQQDLQIIFENTKLIDQLDLHSVQNIHRNMSKSMEEITFEFFLQIPKRLALQIYKYYELDFDMFGYDKYEALEYVKAGYDDQ